MLLVMVHLSCNHQQTQQRPIRENACKRVAFGSRQLKIPTFLELSHLAMHCTTPYHINNPANSHCPRKRTGCPEIYAQVLALPQEKGLTANSQIVTKQSPLTSRDSNHHFYRYISTAKDYTYCQLRTYVADCGALNHALRAYKGNTRYILMCCGY